MRKKLILFVSLFFFHFQFPQDHTFHSDYGLEWVYFVGHLETESKDIFGYELSFFRVKWQKSAGQSMELFPVHFAISHPRSKDHQTAQTRIRKDLGNLAIVSPERISIGEYRVEFLSPHKFRLVAKPVGKDFALDLILEGDTKILSQGVNGISQKSYQDPSIFSYYYSYPRLSTKGTLTWNQKKISITEGNSWMDHEWSEKILESGNSFPKLAKVDTSWDWVCLWDEDGNDYTFFQFKKTGDSAPETFGTFREKGKSPMYFKEPNQVVMNAHPQGFWKSPKTKIVYPLEWSIQVKQETWRIKPLFLEQEFDGVQSTGIVYWEGMVEAENLTTGKRAKGYMELKGYKPKRYWWEVW